uniref:Predicted protein n=1 Tax=Hordeum vulgare subsp. vulgare TaxID=112509 RepID=F2EEY2_HORVV|nr:predicted protein [Hordeum vulgare subsp. vulgare]
MHCPTCAVVAGAAGAGAASTGKMGAASAGGWPDRCATPGSICCIPAAGSCMCYGWMVRSIA